MIPSADMYRLSHLRIEVGLIRGYSQATLCTEMHVLAGWKLL
jgi:hypothetical protein